jgi:hypothetical protein
LLEIDRQIKQLVAVLGQVRRQRPLLDQLDRREEQRLSLEARQRESRPESVPLLDLSPAALRGFVSQYRYELATVDFDTKKARWRRRNVVGSACDARKGSRIFWASGYA